MQLLHFLVVYFLCCIVFVFSRETVIIKPEDVVTNQEKCKNNRKDACRLVETVVHLEAKDDNCKISPNQVTVPRCYRHSKCNSEYKCLPKKMHIEQFPVNIITMTPFARTCSFINVTVHDKCGCECDISKEVCEKNKKVFSLQDCTCKCGDKHAKEKKECNDRKTMVWREEICKCVCTSKMMTCSTGQVWVPQHCRCMTIMDNQIEMSK